MISKKIINDDVYQPINKILVRIFDLLEVPKEIQNSVRNDIRDYIDDELKSLPSNLTKEEYEPIVVELIKEFKSYLFFKDIEGDK